MIYIFLEQTCTEQIPDTRSACHKPKSPKILNGRLTLGSFSRKFQPKTDVGLRFEVVQSYSGRYGLNKLSLTMYTSLRSNLALFIFAPFLSDSNRNFLQCAKKGGLHATVG